jgi:hypothetical protein
MSDDTDMPTKPACPFDGKTDLKPTDPCPVCGDLGTMDSEESGRCVSIWLTNELASELNDQC